MATLKDLKGEIKAWERSFKAEKGREPTKDDIKLLPGMASKYKLYRQLSKDATTTKPIPPTDPTEPSTSTSSIAKKLFQTPTKPKSTTNFGVSEEGTPKGKPSMPVGLITPRSNGSARNPFLSPSKPTASSKQQQSSSSSTATSPFSRLLGSSSVMTSAGGGPNITLISNSPKRLREVLEAASTEQRNAVRAAKEAGMTTSPSNGNGNGHRITPRTRARKRLRGEEVDDTPGRSKVARTIGGIVAGGRGGGKKNGGKEGLAGEKSGLGMGMKRTLSGRMLSRAITPDSESGEDHYDNGNGIRDDDDHDGDEEGEEVFGPTPTKGSGNKNFAALFEQGSGKGPSKGKGRALDEMDVDEQPIVKGKLLFQDNTKDKQAESSSALTSTAQNQTALTASTSPSAQLGPGDPVASRDENDLDDDEDEDELPAPPSPTAETLAAEQETNLEPPSSQKLPPQIDEGLAHELELSSEEEDDFDDDGEDRRIRRVRKIRVEPYRLGLQKRLAKAKAEEEEEEDQSDSDDGREGLHHRNGQDMISGLSLASPQAKIAQRTEKLHEARAKAVFDQKAKKQLKAKRRPEVYLPGEAAHEVDEDGEPVEMEEEEGDEDWESDPDGWKTVGLPDDDDW